MKNDKLNELLDSNKKNVKVENLAMSVGELISMYESGELILKPEYQRLLKWDSKQKTLLIESLLLGLPMPSVFVSANTDGKWEIVDGLQRVSTIVDYVIGLKRDDTKYMEPKYIRFNKLGDGLVYLGGENVDTTFENTSFNDFPQKIQLELKRQRVNVVVLLSGTAEDVKYELFQRVNQGGTPISNVDLRRSILIYKNPAVLEKIEETAKTQLFTSLFPESLFASDSLSPQAIIAFFLTFQRKSDAIIKKEDKVISVEGFITSYFRSLDKDDAMKDLKLLNSVLEKLNSINFTKEKTKIFFGSQRYSDTVFGAITLGIAFNLSKLPDNKKLKEKIENSYTSLSQNDVAKRGFSAPARIPKMIEFAREHFSE